MCLSFLAGISKFSGGCMHHIPLFSTSKPQLVKTLQKCFERYLTRKIGFEAVMRVRCTRGLAIHTFHGNFFVRSTDLLSLPNVNPDAGFGMQVGFKDYVQVLTQTNRILSIRRSPMKKAWPTSNRYASRRRCCTPVAKPNGEFASTRCVFPSLRACRK